MYAPRISMPGSPVSINAFHILSNVSGRRCSWAVSGRRRTRQAGSTLRPRRLVLADDPLANLGDRVVRELDSVEPIYDEDRVGQSVAHALREGRGRVDGHVRDCVTPRRAGCASNHLDTTAADRPSTCARSPPALAESTNPVCHRSCASTHLPVSGSRVQAGLPRWVSSIPSTFTTANGAVRNARTWAMNALWTVAHPTP